jgi:hypothetical protein
MTLVSASATAIELSRVIRPTYLRIRREAAPATVRANGATLTAVTTDAALDASATGWRYDATNRVLWVKLAAGLAVTVDAT